MIGVVIFPDFQLLDASGPISVFEIAGRLAGNPASIRVMEHCNMRFVGAGQPEEGQATIRYAISRDQTT